MTRRLVPLFTLLFGCASEAPRAEEPPVATAVEASPTSVPTTSITLVETVPIETKLGFEDVPDTHPTWLAMIEGAEREISLGHFYATEQADVDDRLDEVIHALEAAEARGVNVRVLLDALFAEDNAETHARLGERLELRTTKHWAPRGGIQHAKYMVVDGDDAYVGSANFDWRSLEHIHELGLRVQGAPAAALAALFQADWRAAAGEAPAYDELPSFAAVAVDGGGRLALVGSPVDALPDEDAWELSRLLNAIGTATSSIEVQLLSYEATYRNDDSFPQLQQALLAAAGRGIEVRLLLSDWQKRHLDDVRTLQRAEHITVKLVTIPAASAGFIPFARVVHAKYAVFDRDDAWLGSSNWKGDYFYKGRNLGAWLTGTKVGPQLHRGFEQLWSSPYAETLDPDATYTPPKVK